MSGGSPKLRSYELNGQKYYLPPPSLVKPLTDGMSGNLDTWPAHASGRNEPTSQVAVTRDKRLVVIADEDVGRASLVPKPRFLEQLEGYLNREIKAHGVTSIEASTVRLQIHKEVFEYLIEAFKSYKPLLSSIKREYDLMLEFYRQEISRLEPMREMLWTQAQEHEQKIMELRDEEKDEIKHLKTLNKGLHQRISDMKEEQLDLEAQLDKVTNELAEEHHRYRDEADSRKLLVSDLNELRSQQEDMNLFKQNASTEEEEDPVQMRIALAMAKKGQAEVLEKLNTMEANYCDVIPRSDYENLLAKHTKLEGEFGTFKEQFDKIHTDYKVLQETYDQVLKQRDQFFQEAETLHRSATPRPEWQRVSEHVYGGLERWNELSAGKTSNELVDVLLQEMTGNSSGGIADGSLLESLGMVSTVPKFLHHPEGEVLQNRKMSKRDTKIHIRELMDGRKLQKDEQADAGERGETMTLSPIGDFADVFFRKVYGIDQIRVEWAYSFYDALGRFAADERIGQFLGIIKGEIDEEVYWEEMRYMGKLLDHFKNSDSEDAGELSKEKMSEVLASFFPKKEEQDIRRLLEVMVTELEAGNPPEEAAAEEAPEEDEEPAVLPGLEYDKLFLSDDEGEFGMFLKEVRKFLYEEKNKYIDEIQKELVDLTSEKISVEELERAIAIVDTDIDKYQQDAYVCWAFSVSNKDDLANCSALEIQALCARLRNGNIKRAEKRV